MATDPANIEGIQEQKAQESTQGATEQAVRQLLHVLDPQADATQPYPALLQHLQNVLAGEAHRLMRAAPVAETPPAPTPPTEAPPEEETPDGTL